MLDSWSAVCRASQFTVFEMDLMTPADFEEAIRMLRSADAETYEEGFCWLEAEENLLMYIPAMADRMQSEEDPRMRSSFVELIGNADLEEYIPLLAQELSHQNRLVRSWAYGVLSRSDHEFARALADDYRQTHPEEDFY